MEIKPLSEVSFIDISGVDKKIKENEQIVKLCNFTDVYYNWSVSRDNLDKFMIATANENEIKRFSLNKGSVAITKDSETREDIGIACYISDDLENTLLGYHCALIAPKKGILDGKYLNAYLQTKMASKYFSNQASGSGQRYTLTIGGIGAVKIPVISFEKQVKIGKVFSNIDRKIANNNKITVKIESIAKTLYDYWFLQFDFPNEKGQPYRSSGGKMIWSKEYKQEIPDGWEVRKISEILFESNKSKIQVNESKEKGKYPFFTSGESIYAYDEHFVDGFNIFLNTGGNPDIKAFMGKCAYSTDTWCISAADYSFVLYYYFLKIIPQFEQLFFAGSGLKHLQKDVLKSKYILLPDTKTLKMFNDFCVTSWKKYANYYTQNLELMNLRDFLLPLLMNGQVTFK